MTDRDPIHPEELEFWRRCAPRPPAPGEVSACPDPETLAAFLDGRLPPDEQDDVEGHLAGCGTCLDAILEIRAAMADRGVRLPLVPPHVIAAARDLVGGSPRRRLAPLGWAVAAAAAIIVCVAGYAAGTAAGPQRSIEEPVVAMIEDAWKEDLLGIDPLDDPVLEASWLLIGEVQP